MKRMSTKTLIAEMGEQLEVSETKCEAIKSQLGYMKTLYHQAIPSGAVESKSKEFFGEDLHHFSKLYEKNQYQADISKDLEEFLNQQNSQIRDFKNGINELHNRIEETIETTRTNSKKSIESLKALQAKIENETEEIMKSCNHGSNVSRTIILSSIEENENLRNEDFKINFNHNSAQDLSLELSRSSKVHESSTESKEEQVIKKMVIKERKNLGINKEDLILKFSKSLEGVRSNKKKRTNKFDKRCKTGRNKSLTNKKSSARLNDSIITIANVKKKIGRLRSFNSKSTISTVKDTNLTERKERKRKKRKSLIKKSYVPSLEHPEPKIQENVHDIVELYHNVALKAGSMSVISSKHSTHFPESGPSLNNFKKMENHQKSNKIKPNEKLPTIDDFPKQELSENKKMKEEIVDVENAAKYLHSYPGSKSYDPMLIRNYEQPTVSSKLKKVQRSYYNRFNFRNIPFTVGTSISPSHNLGLNIQQVLSIMKTKQAKSRGISPLFRKMSQGIRPITSPSAEIESHNFFSLNNPGLKNLAVNCQSQMSSTHKVSNFPRKHCQTQQSCSQKTCGTVFEEKELHSDDKDLTISQTKTNAKENRDVLIKLHDQFEEMNTKYEKLQEKAEKFKDKSLTKEIEKLEVDLATKEEEINAVVGLFKEVMFLKKQMKRMSEKNSFVCISSESSNACPIINYAHNPMIRAYLAPHLQMNKSRGNSIANVREPSTGTRLTGLLRQIQMFQWQLKQT